MFKKNKTLALIFYTYIAIALVMASFCILKSSSSKSYNVGFDAFHTEEGSEYPLCIKSDYINLPAGNYILLVEYVSNGGYGNVSVTYDNDYMANLKLTDTQGGMARASHGFTLEKPSDWMKMQITGDENINLACIRIESDRMIYSDYLFYALFWVAGIALMYVLLKVYEKSESKFSFYLVLASCIIAVIPVFIDGNNIRSGVDIRDHMLRIDGIFMGLKEKQWPVIINPNMNNQFGQAAVLYPNMFLYIAGIMRYLRASMQIAYKTIAVLVHVANIISMYLCARYISRDKDTSALAAFSYLSIIMSYYLQGSTLATGLATIFIPMAVAGTIGILRKEEKYSWIILAVAMSAVMSSHVLNLLLTVILLILVVVIFIIINKGIDRVILTYTAKSVVLSLLLSIGVIVPFADFYFAGFNDAALDITDFYANCMNITDFLTTTPVMMLVLALCVLLIIINKKLCGVSADKAVASVMIAAVVMLIMCTKVFPWRFLLKIELINKIGKMIQWPGRMTNQIIACLAIVFACELKLILSAENEKVNNKGIKMWTYTVIIAAVVLFASVRYYKYFSLDYIVENKLVQEYGYRNNEDYLPKGTKTEYYASAVGRLSDESNILVHEYKKQGTRAWFTYETASNGEYAEFPIFYYKGYVAKDEDGNDYDVSCGDKNFVRVSLKATQSPVRILLYYKVKTAYLIFAIVSGLMYIALFVSVIRKYKMTGGENDI